jgi:hypothetical protein
MRAEGRREKCTKTPAERREKVDKHRHLARNRVAEPVGPYSNSYQYQLLTRNRGMLEPRVPIEPNSPCKYRSNTRFGKRKQTW